MSKSASASMKVPLIARFFSLKHSFCMLLFFITAVRAISEVSGMEEEGVDEMSIIDMFGSSVEGTYNCCGALHFSLYLMGFL